MSLKSCGRCDDYLREYRRLLFVSPTFLILFQFLSMKENCKREFTQSQEYTGTQ